MSEQVELTNPVDLSVGGMSGHIFRRFFHLAMFIIPVLYFEYGEDVAEKVGMTLDEVVATFVLVAVIGELIRLKLGFTVFGQREYESKQVSALAWGALAIGLVLLITPTKEYAYPLIFTLTFGDPFMGELRRKVSIQRMSLAACVRAGNLARLLVCLWHPNHSLLDSCTNCCTCRNAKAALHR